MGYAGGAKRNPTYHSLGDHTETLQIDYDPTQISYDELLAIFWASHNPTGKAWSRQYMAAIFYHNDAQQAVALATKEAEAKKRRAEIQTVIAPAGPFYLAEDYHQKYALRQTSGLMQEFKQIYPDRQAFTNSTAAARINGYVSGYGTLAQLQAELDDLGLSPKGRQKLLELTRRYHR